MDGPGWHALSAEAVYDRLDADPDGLSADEAADRLDRHGPNELSQGELTSPWRILLHQFTSPLIYVLLVAFVVTIGIHHYADAIVIAVVLVLNAVVGFVQEYRAENAMAALRSLVSPTARVRRDGDVQTVPSADLVPGDEVRLQSGDVVPADVRLRETTDLQVDTSILTGESLPVAREPGVEDPDTPLADRSNLVYMGTSVVSGRGTGVVVATGEDTEMGHIAREVRGTARAATPLQERMHRFGTRISVAILGVAAVIFAVGLWQGIPVADVFLLAVATAVSAIPEGLPVVMTVALAVSVRRMAGRHAIVRRLPAVETLGSCSVIVSDKTGTITENRMTVQRLWTVDGPVAVGGDPDAAAGEFRRDGDPMAPGADQAVMETLRAATLANEASVRVADDGRLQGEGDPTETALLVAARKAGLDRSALLEDAPQVGHVPFESDRQYAASVHRTGGNPGEPGESADTVTYVKGAPERIVDMCETVATDDGTARLDREALTAAADDMAADGLRVIAMARGAGDLTDEDPPSGLTFLGFAGMLDPPREAVPDAIAACRRAGVRVLMVTGDHAETARAIADRVGIDAERVLTGSEVAALSDAALTERLRETSVFARIAPTQKHRIVSLLQADGEVVAVTGDGVNDAPALKAAHIGAAMGITGTDVAKEASEMVLTDDNFATIYAAIEEGRTVFANIRKATSFLLTTGVALVLAILATFALAVAGLLPPIAAVGVPVLLLPAQALWLNVVNNGIQDVALAFEPGEREQYERPPHSPDAGLLSRELTERTLLVGLVLAVLAVAVFWWRLAEGASEAAAQTAALTTMVVSNALFLGSVRSQHRSVLGKSPLSNPVLLVGTLAAMVVHLVAIYAPPTQFLLGLEPIAPAAWLLILAVSPLALVVAELHKRFRR